VFLLTLSYGNCFFGYCASYLFYPSDAPGTITPAGAVTATGGIGLGTLLTVFCYLFEVVGESAAGLIIATAYFSSPSPSSPSSPSSISIAPCVNDCCYSLTSNFSSSCIVSQVAAATIF